jgi:diacylglycerol kinase family enzyme
VRARVRTVLVGNLGRLQGGLELLPDARPDDGLLDVALVAPRGPVDWVVLLVRGLTGGRRRDHRLRTWQARRVDVRMHRPQPRQVDGDVIDDADHLRVHVEAGALVVRVARDTSGPDAEVMPAAATLTAATATAPTMAAPAGQE